MITSMPSIPARGAALVAALSSLCLGCPPPADTGEPVPAGSFSALTYNVHGLPPEITGDDTTGRQAQIAPLLSGYDIAALQEDFIESNHALLTGEADWATARWFDEVIDGRAYGSGLALLSPFVEEAYHQQHYSQCHGTIDGSGDCLASKGLQLVRLRLGAGSLDVYNTHHEAGGGDEDNAARLSQVEEVLAAMDEHSAGRAVLFLGDFNLHGDDPEDQPPLDLYYGYGLEDACDVLACPEPGRIDRAWFRSGDTLDLTPTDWAVQEQFVDAQGEDLSDHEPIAVGFDWAVR
jgi:endonuclease/exonuclease/phosphatase family metal-dependent hydrolase